MKEEEMEQSQKTISLDEVNKRGEEVLRYYAKRVQSIRPICPAHPMADMYRDLAAGAFVAWETITAGCPVDPEFTEHMLELSGVSRLREKKS
jgi:hypothetical protein